ncbi:hypothetical protein HMPREF1326_01746 [Akkermansia sp. KLE1605]|nr:hypothetical protein HMPREF1326_01746 [Akkermansia sp. KLE1605]
MINNFLQSSSKVSATVLKFDKDLDLFWEISKSLIVILLNMYSHSFSLSFLLLLHSSHLF